MRKRRPRTHISLYYLPNVMDNINLTNMWLDTQKVIVWYEKKVGQGLDQTESWSSSCPGWKHFSDSETKCMNLKQAVVITGNLDKER